MRLSKFEVESASAIGIVTAADWTTAAMAQSAARVKMTGDFMLLGWFELLVYLIWREECLKERRKERKSKNASIYGTSEKTKKGWGNGCKEMHHKDKKQERRGAG
jgi:hypothetical protein